MREKVDKKYVYQKSIKDLLVSDIEDKEKDLFNERLQNACIEILETGQELKYEGLARRMYLHYPGITRHEIFEYSRDVVDRVLKNYE